MEKYKEMRLSNIYNKLNMNAKYDFICGLAYGLAFGLVGGLVYGLAFGLVGGLVCGLVCGLVYGLVSGLVVILIKFAEALPFINGTLPVFGLIFGLIILMEILFWLSPKEKVKKKNLFQHTLLRKGESLLKTLIIFSAITQIYILAREVDFVKYFPEILKCIGYIGYIGCIGYIGYYFIKINSLKYSKTK